MFTARDTNKYFSLCVSYTSKLTGEISKNKRNTRDFSNSINFVVLIIHNIDTSIGHLLFVQNQRHFRVQLIKLIKKSAFRLTKSFHY